MCVYYNDLVSRDLEKYIRGYDMYFDARRNYSCVDYSMPTVNRSVRGILSLIHILEELTSEADFVNAFPPEMTGELWNRYLSELAHPAGDMLSLGQLCYEHAILTCCRLAVPHRAAVARERGQARLLPRPQRRRGETLCRRGQT